MEKTHPNRLSSAVRKRRSSILKNQRPPRTPLSELEFNAATPTDTTKSRRVSFSRRTGVAEFVTNEATTTWKNVYEKHNKSDSLGNDSGINNLELAVPVGPNIRTFDQQFQDVEADLVNTLGHPRSRKINVGFNSINITDQLALDQSTSNVILKPPTQNFELSLFTENQQSKIFGNDFVDPDMGETSGGIYVDFSDIQTIGDSVKDDLDEISEDCRRNANQGLIRERRHISQYIEVNLDTTYRQPCDDQSDMSITDTISSPKVQGIPEGSARQNSKKQCDKDWVTDKENILVNPYVAPAETDNFAVSEVAEKVLVFDGKNLKYASVDADLDELEDFGMKRASSKGSMANMLVLDDDLSTQLDTEQATTSKKVLEYQQNEVKETAYDNDILENKNEVHNANMKTIIYDDDNENVNISITQCVTINNDIVNLHNTDKTHLFNQDHSMADMSVTKVVCQQLLDKTSSRLQDTCNKVCQVFGANISHNKNRQLSEESIKCVTNTESETLQDETNPDIAKNPVVKRKTIVLNVDDDLPNFVSDIPPQLYQSTNAQGTIIYDRDESLMHSLSNITAEGLSKTKIVEADMSVTQAMLGKIDHQPRRTTILFNEQEDKFGDISMTQALNGLISLNKEEKRKTIVFEADDIGADVSMTQALPGRIAVDNEGRRQTIHFTDDGNLSMTQALPMRIDQGEIQPQSTENKRRTIVFDDNVGDLSVTQAVPSTLILKDQDYNVNVNFDSHTKDGAIVCDNTDISFTRVVSTDVSRCTKGKRVTICYEKDNSNADMSITQAISKRNTIVRDASIGGILENKLINVNNEEKKFESSMKEIRTINDNDDISMAEVIGTKLILKEQDHNAPMEFERRTNRQTIVFDNANLSMTEIVSNEIYRDTQDKRMTIGCTKDSDNEIEMHFINQGLPLNSTTKIQDKLADTNSDKSTKRQTIVFEDADISITQVIPQDVIKNVSIKRITSDFGKDNARKDVPNARSIHQNVSQVQCHELVHQAMEDVVVYQSATTSSNKTLTQSIRKINEAETSIIKKTCDASENGSKENYYESHSGLLSRQKSNNFDSCIDSKGSPPLIMQNLFKRDILAANMIKPEVSVSQNLVHIILPSERDNDLQCISELDLLKSTIQEKYNEEESNKKIVTVYSPKLLNSEFEEPVNDIIYTETLINKSDKLEQRNSQHITVKENEHIVDECNELVDGINQTSNRPAKPKKSILHELLDMSDASMEIDKPSSETKVDKSQTVALIEKKNMVKKASSEILIPIIRDSEDDIKSVTIDANQEHELEALTNKNKGNEEVFKIVESLAKPVIECQQPLPLEYIDDTSDNCNLLNDKTKESKKFNKFKLKRNSVTKGKKTASLESDVNNIRTLNNSQFKSDSSNINKNKSLKGNNDTQDLLEMLTGFTDSKSARRSSTNKSPSSIKDKNKHESKYKQITKDVAPSLSLKRKSVTESKKELLNKISRTQSIIQKDEQDSDENIDDSLDISHTDLSKPKRHTIRLSQEIRKTLQFEDEESLSYSNTKLSPLKKTAFGESSYMKECKKSKVIPTYLKDVSDGIKQLMGELVKPMADVPHANNKEERTTKNPSTCSMHIQANLITSSQVDLDIEIPSNSDSLDCNTKKTISDALKGQRESSPKKLRECKLKEQENHPGRVIHFDSNNPLNNILLPPLGLANVETHKYNPMVSSDNVAFAENNEVNIVRVSTKHFFKDSMVKEDESNDKKSVTISDSLPIVEARQSRDQCIEAKMYIAKDTEVNTLIAMKQNEELLDASSSLTLVDDALKIANFDINLDLNSTATHTAVNSYGRENPIYDMVITSKNEHAIQSDKTDRKRSYSPSANKKVKYCTFDNLSPASKSQKKHQKKTKSPENKKAVSPAGKSFIVQQMTASATYEMDTAEAESIDVLGDDVISINTSESLPALAPSNDRSEFLEGCVSPSCASSKNQMRRNTSDTIANVEKTPANVTEKCLGESSDWPLEFEEGPSSADFLRTYKREAAAKLLSDIKATPYMGTKHCILECKEGDTWSFLLLHSRIRMYVRFTLEDKDDYVTPCTPVGDITVDIIKQESIPVAAQCVSICAECIICAKKQFYDKKIADEGHANKGGMVAASLPGLLQTCAELSRNARLWGQAMNQAQLRLAYKFTQDGGISLKVANVSLRSLWEVCLRVRVVCGAEGAWGAPRPHAEDVQVRPVCSRLSPREGELARVARAVPPDWGHVPNTLWTVFKYLKHKTADSASLIG